MTLQQPQTKVADFDLMVSRILESMKQLRERGENLYVFLIPLKKEGKNPDVHGKIYESDPNDENIERPREDCIISPETARGRLGHGTGNVGIVGFKGIYKNSLAFFDFDVEDGHTVIPQEEILKFVKENDLFAVRTRNGGIHVYVVNAGNFDNAIIEYNGKHAGEIRAHKQYVVAPGSAVPVSAEDEKKPTREATGVYEVIHDGEIKIVPNHMLPSWFAIMNEVPRKKIASLHIDFDAANPNQDGKWQNDLGMTVSEACEEEEDDALSELILSHKLTNSKLSDRSSADWFVARRLWWWRFSPQQIVEIMRHYRWYSKTAREDYMTHTVAKASDGPQYRTNEELMRETPAILTDAEKFNVETFPEEIPKNKKIVHVRGLPRTGKSYWGLTQIARFGEGVYVAPNHEIIEQQFTTFTTRIAPELTAVWLVGKDRACNTRNAAGLTGDCMNCPLRPVNDYAKEEGSEELTTRRYEEYAIHAIAKYRHITASLMAKQMPYACPYYMVHFAEKHVKVCFTVPHFTTTSDSITQCTPRKLMVMDEDTVFHHYQPESVTLIEYMVRGNGSNSVTLFTPDIMDKLDDLKSFIEEKERIPAYDKIMLSVIETYRGADGLFKTFAEEPKIFGTTVAERKSNIEKELQRLDFAFSDISNDMKTKVLEKLSEYEKEMYIHSETGLSTIFEPMLFPYRQSRFVWIGRNPATLYMVGNKREIIRTPIPSDQYLLIGFTEAELFAKHLLAQGGAKLMREPGQQTLDSELSGGVSQLLVRHFPYGKNFIYMVLTGSRRMQAKLMRVTRAILVAANRESEWRAPFMTITSSMKKQTQLWENIPSDEAMMCRKEPIERTYQRYRIGIGAIIYQNSTISRGIDVPWYDIIFVDSCNFAQPYWSASQEHYENEIERLRSLLRPIEQLSDAEKDAMGIPVTEPGAPPIEFSKERRAEIAKKQEDIRLQLRLVSEEHKEVMRIRYSLLMDETTNSALRTSPVPGCGEGNTKVIFIKEKDVHLLNSDAKDSMTRYEVSENSNVNSVVEAIREMSQKVNPEALCQKTEGEDKSLMDELYYITKSRGGTQQESPKSVQRGELRSKKEEELKSASASNPDIVNEKEQRKREIIDEIVNNTLKPTKDRDMYRRTMDSIVRNIRKRHTNMAVKEYEVKEILDELVRKGVLQVDVERNDEKGVRMEYYKYAEKKKGDKA